MANLTTLDDPDEESPDERASRARREEMVVIPQTTTDGLATGIYLAHTESANVYTVDITDDRRCDCPDMQYNAPENGCKHWQRVEMALDETRLPAPEEPVGPYLEALQEARDDLLAELVKHEERVATLNYLLEGIDGALDD